jgi:GTP-binding protein
MGLNVRDCAFVKSAADSPGFIFDGRPQVIFSGRSNVGKSSVINRLVGRKNFARTGSSPGKTANVNYFLVGGAVYFVDLPGYGYARVSDSERRRWGHLMEQFFERPDVISLGVMLVDMRHRPTADDTVMAKWFAGADRPFVVVANKSDKVKPGEADGRLAAIRDALALDARVRVLPFSAETGANRDGLVAEINARCR